MIQTHISPGWWPLSHTKREQTDGLATFARRMRLAPLSFPVVISQSRKTRRHKASRHQRTVHTHLGSDQVFAASSSEPFMTQLLDLLSITANEGRLPHSGVAFTGHMCSDPCALPIHHGYVDEQRRSRRWHKMDACHRSGQRRMRACVHE